MTTEAATKVLAAAERVLGARQADMLTIDEWIDLARAVAAATHQKAADLLTAHDLEDIAQHWPEQWDEAVDGPLPKVQ